MALFENKFRMSITVIGIGPLGCNRESKRELTLHWSDLSHSNQYIYISTNVLKKLDECPTIQLSVILSSLGCCLLFPELLESHPFVAGHRTRSEFNEPVT
jgi:hypothetical protein